MYTKIKIVIKIFIKWQTWYNVRIFKKLENILKIRETHAFLPNWLIFLLNTIHRNTVPLSWSFRLALTHARFQTDIFTRHDHRWLEIGREELIFLPRARPRIFLDRADLPYASRLECQGKKSRVWGKTKDLIIHVMIRPRKLCSRPQMWGTRGLVSRVSRWRFERDAFTRVKWKSC